MQLSAVPSKEQTAMETLTLSRMARRLGVTAQWLREEAEAGRLPCVKAGKRYIFEPQAVQSELARRAATSRLAEVAHA